MNQCKAINDFYIAAMNQYIRRYLIQDRLLYAVRRWKSKQDYGILGQGRVIQSIVRMDYSYLSPPKKAARLKLPKPYIYESVNGKHKRRIFAKPPYESFEIEAIEKLKGILNKKAPYMTYPDELLLRFNYLGNFLLSQATEKVKLYDDWHENQVITHLHKPGREILECGHIYAYGRDYDYCPIIFVRPNQFDLKKYTPDDYFNAIANLLNPLEQHMLLAGVIEKWNVVVDFEGKKCVWGNDELMSRCFTKIASAYPFRLKRLIFLNTHPQNEQIQHLVTTFLDGISTDADIRTFGEAAQLAQISHDEEREKRYGGKLHNLCEYWPIHTTNKYEDSDSEHNSESEYRTVMNDAEYFQQDKVPLCDVFKTKCQIY